MEQLWQDIRFALRLMRRSRGFTAAAVLSLALGIGANTAIFSLIDALVLRPLPVRQPEQLVELLTRYPDEPRVNGWPWKYFEHFRDHNHVFSDLIATSGARFQVAEQAREPEPVDGEYIVGTFFQTLGVQPALGRLIGPQNDRPGAPEAAVAVVSWPYWQRRFNLDPAIAGKQIVVNGAAATVIGVTPPGFFGLQVGVTPDIWLPMSMEPLIQRPSRLADGTLGVKMIGRLKPDVSIGQVRADMALLNQWRIEDTVKTRNAPFLRDLKLEVESARAGFSALRDRFAGPLVALMAMVGLLLLIACTNIASLLLARAAARRREMAVRVALGASRARLARQTLTESLILSVSGSALGIFLAYLGANALVRVMLSGREFIAVPQRVALQVIPDARMLLFTSAVAIATGVLFGLAPALNALAFAPSSSMREGGSAGEPRSRRLFGKSLVVGQVAVSLVLLSAATVFARHLSNLRNVDLGFQRDSVLLVTLNPQGSGLNGAQLTRLSQELLGRLENIPGVRSASVSAVTPIEGPGAARFVNAEGFQERPEDRRYIPLNWVGPKYFDTFGTPLVAGRDFQFGDANRPRVAIVNQAMAAYYFRGRSPLGQHLTFDGDTMPYEIIGVAGDAKYQELREAAPRTIYLNTFQEGRIFSQFSLRTSVPPATVTNDVRRAVSDVLKTVRVGRVTTLTDQMDASIVSERIVAMLSGLFGSLGSALAALGLYGLLAFTVARRTHEIGIRMALGATEGDVARMVLKGALGLVATGLLVGAPLAFWSRRFAATLLENLAVESAMPLALSAAVLVAVALAAAYVPARRASRVAPAVALRQE